MKAPKIIRPVVLILQENKQPKKQLLSHNLQIASNQVNFKSFEIWTRILHNVTRIAALFIFITHQKSVNPLKRMEASLNIFLSFFSYSAQTISGFVLVKGKRLVKHSPRC